MKPQLLPRVSLSSIAYLIAASAATAATVQERYYAHPAVHDRAVDLTFLGITPRNGVIDIRFTGGDPEHGVGGEAFVQAVEVGPEVGGGGATPVCILARNLLRDGGFEAATPQTGSKPRAVIGAWRFAPLGTGSTRIDRESEAKTGGAGEPGTGSDAARISGKGRSRLVQEVAVRSESTYRGSVWVLARDNEGGGFGHGTRDSAGVILEELDAAGNLLTAHPKAAVTEAGPFHYLSREITTTAKTVRVRFTLLSKIGCVWREGAAIYDECALEAAPAKE